MLRYGADGLVRVNAADDDLLVDAPIRSAMSDGAGGVLYSLWEPGHLSGPTWWLPPGSDEPRRVSGDFPRLAASLDGRAVVIGGFPAEECFEDAVDRMVARDLRTGSDTTLQCATGGPDDGWGPDSFGGGLYVGDHWSAVLEQGALYSSIELVFRDEGGDVIDHPANPYDDDCRPCELTPALSPDGTRLAVIFRPDALQFRNEDWSTETTSVNAQLQVFDLQTGDLLFEQLLAAGAQPQPPGWHSWFDGRFVVLGPDRFDHPNLSSGDRGPEVSTLQRLLVQHGANLEIDGIFGPSTEGAVEAFHASRFEAPASSVDPLTWTTLGVPSTIIDTHTGETVEVPGAITLEVTFAEDTVSWAGDDTSNSGILRSNGIGPFAFGAEADDVEAWLTERLGPPEERVVETGQLGWPLEACDERRAAYWADTGLTVAYTDRDRSGTCASTPRLAAWMLYVDAPWFSEHHADDSASTTDVELLGVTTGAGIGLGSSVAEVHAVHPYVEFGTWGLDSYDPAWFRVLTEFEGRIEWNAVIDAQRALNSRGASLEVDGILGPETRQALDEFQESAGIVETRPDGDAVVAVIGPATLAALGIGPPDDARVEYLAAGDWTWDF